MLYFITQTDEYVKIGYTEDSPNQRLSALQIGNPKQLKLSRLLPGNKAKELKLHAKFAPYSVRGEWFYLSHEIKSYIRNTRNDDVRYIDQRVIT